MHHPWHGEQPEGIVRIQGRMRHRVREDVAVPFDLHPVRRESGYGAGKARALTLFPGAMSSSSHPTYWRTFPPRAKNAVKSGSYTCARQPISTVSCPLRQSTHVHRAGVQVDSQPHRLLVQRRLVPRRIVQHQVSIKVARHGERLSADEAEGVGVFGAGDEAGGEKGVVDEVRRVEAGEGGELCWGKA